MATHEQSKTAPVIIEAALNGGRSRREHPGIPCTQAEVAAAAHEAADAGASIVHVHARSGDDWSASPAWYADAIARIRSSDAPPLISITSIRPAGVPGNAVVSLLDVLCRSRRTAPDLISVNLGHVVSWRPPAPFAPSPPARMTDHFPNDHNDLIASLTACERFNVTPELGVMDLGFISNAVALRLAGVMSETPWFLVELDSPGYGSGHQVAPSTVEDYEVLASRVRQHFPDSAFAAHGVGVAGYAVLRRALADGAHLRVGFEDAVCLPDGTRAESNVDLVRWATDAAEKAGRPVADPDEARRITMGESA
jgi:uncharacterized protein (DUF849 family)